MSLEILVNTVPCVVCKIEQVPCGRMGDTGTKTCEKCKNKKHTRWKRDYRKKHHFCIYCKDNIGTQKTKYCNKRCRNAYNQLIEARKKVKRLKDLMLYYRRTNRINRKRVYVLNNWDKVQAVKKNCKVNKKIERAKLLDEVLKD